MIWRIIFNACVWLIMMFIVAFEPMRGIQYGVAVAGLYIGLFVIEYYYRGKD